ncbi:unnamed protein product [Boreogadus saida]
MVLLHNAIPFVGFGFLDNAIMIVAVSISTPDVLSAGHSPPPAPRPIQLSTSVFTGDSKAGHKKLGAI